MYSLIPCLYLFSLPQATRGGYAYQLLLERVIRYPAGEKWSLADIVLAPNRKDCLEILHQSRLHHPSPPPSARNVRERFSKLVFRVCWVPSSHVAEFSSSCGIIHHASALTTTRVKGRAQHTHICTRPLAESALINPKILRTAVRLCRAFSLSPVMLLSAAVC